MQDPCVTAARYVELSNKHDVEAALAMFAPDARYTSSAQGSHQGIAAIRSMMVPFFSRFPDIHWEVQSYHRTDSRTATFPFEAVATDRETGAPIRRRGVERIRLDASGQIIAVDVEVAITAN